MSLQSSFSGSQCPWLASSFSWGALRWNYLFGCRALPAAAARPESVLLISWGKESLHQACESVSVKLFFFSANESIDNSGHFSFIKKNCTMKIEYIAKIPANKGHFFHYVVNFRVLKKCLFNFFAYKQT